jgi:hypothetical protein
MTQIAGHFHWWSEMMFKKAMIAVAAFVAASAMSAPAEAHRERGRVQVVVGYGSPGYYDPYYQPVHYRPRYRSDYYYQPRYRYRPHYYRYDRYYRPHKRYWKKRHYRRHYNRW